MKLSTCFVALGLALGVVSEPVPIHKRGVDVFLGFLAEIEQGINGLTTLLADYTGGPGDDIIAYSDELVQLILDSVEVAKAEPQLSEEDGLTLAGSIGKLMESVGPPIDILIEKKPLGIENGIAYKVKVAISKMYEATDALSLVIGDKMHPKYKDLAETIRQEILADLQRGVDAYADITPPTSTTTKDPGPTDTETAGPTDTETAGPTETETSGPTDTGPTDSETAGPTETETAGPTDTETAGPTDTETAGPTDTETAGPTDSCDPEETETVTVTECDPGEPTDTCAPGVTETVTVTETETECGPGEPTDREPPEPTDEVPPPEPTDEGPPPEPTDEVPPPEPTDGAPPPDTTGPPGYDGAGAVNKVGPVGVLAALAVVLAL